MRRVAQAARRQEGFTLIELLIVIIILAILIGIAVPIYLSVKGSAAKRTCESNMKSIKGACRALMFDKNWESWPSALNGDLDDVKDTQVAATSGTSTAVLSDYEDAQEPWECPDGGTYTLWTSTTGAPEVACGDHGALGDE